MSTHHVYVFWDADDNPIYVGMTGNLRRRMREHDRRSPWVSRAAYITRTAYPDRMKARIAEGRTIYALAPDHNHTCNPRYWTDEEIAYHEPTRARFEAKLASVRAVAS